ncbi:VOC family protein [Aquipuribacter sp. SD81]|uniref:VOC family protein n=1 Tax=Aquipuribacter sp. SD81 TaxID=3127703 RepID=UPI0030187283
MTDLLPGAEALGALTVFVLDVEAEAAFCRDALGLTPVLADEQSAVVRLGATLLNMLRADAVGDLVAPARSAAVGETARMLLSLWVDDVDAVCAELGRRGVPLLNGPVDQPWGKRTAAFRSPAGIVWEVAQDL